MCEDRSTDTVLWDIHACTREAVQAPSGTPTITIHESLIKGLVAAVDAELEHGRTPYQIWRRLMSAKYRDELNTHFELSIKTPMTIDEPMTIGLDMAATYLLAICEQAEAASTSQGESS